MDFLRGPAAQARALYILGDLFEAWIGDDDPSALSDEVAAELRALSDAGVETFFVCGNRDFLLGDDYCRRAGMQRLEEPVFLSGSSLSIALLHGDRLCTDDHDYQRFRARVRDPRWQARILSRPLWWRRILARAARSISRRRNRANRSEIMDVSPQAVVEEFRQQQVQRLIHGHTHRPAVHRLEIDGRSVARIVLGDWHEDRASVARLTDDKIELLALACDGAGQINLSLVDSLSHSVTL
jgi:UDP-2,3-diacylglucosamine hydrolase